MRPLTVPLALLGIGLFSGCMVDLYGGNPRLQVSNDASRWRIRHVGVGDTADPLWRESFDPLIHSGSTTRVMEIPVAGAIRVFVGIRDSLDRDSVAQVQLLVEDGEFRKLEMTEDSLGRLRVHSP